MKWIKIANNFLICISLRHKHNTLLYEIMWGHIIICIHIYIHNNTGKILIIKATQDN